MPRDVLVLSSLAARACVGVLATSAAALARDVSRDMPHTSSGGWTFARHVAVSGEILLDIGFDTASREVTALVGSAADGIWGSSLVLEWPVAYWPTEVRAASERVWIVCGKDPADGATVIERWEFGGEREPGAELVWPARTSVTEVYRETTPGRDVVDLVFVHPARTGHAFVRFQDSCDLYEFDLVTGVYALVASPSSPAPLRWPARRAGFDDGVRCFRHATRGVVFVIEWSAGPCGQFLHTTPRTVLVDADADGVLDGAFRFTADEWLRSDLADASCWSANP